MTSPAAKTAGLSIDKEDEMSSKTIAAIAICLSAGFALADAVQITEENDLFDFFHKNDNQYTQGANISYVRPYVASNGCLEREIYGMSQKIYTPNNTSANYFQPNDRPYCATLTGVYELWTKGSLFDSETVRQTYEMGVMGPEAMGEEAQNGVHSLLSKMGRPNDPAMGWQYQMKNEPVVNYYHERYATMYDAKDDAKWEFNVEAIYGGTAGTEFVNSFVGTKVMFGYNLPQYKVLGGIYPKEMSNGAIESKTSWFYYGFLQCKDIVVVRDATLGQSDWYGQESGIQPYPMVGEFLGGVVVGWDWISLSYGIGDRTKQFVGEHGPFDWGQVILTIGTTF